MSAGAVSQIDLDVFNANNWTPTDVSGAALAIVQNIQARGWFAGYGLLNFWADVTYPATADVMEARLSGPVGQATVGAAAITILVDQPGAWTAYLDGEQIVIQKNGAPATNADLSGAVVTIAGWLIAVSTTPPVPDFP